MPPLPPADLPPPDAPARPAHHAGPPADLAARPPDLAARPGDQPGPRPDLHTNAADFPARPTDLSTRPPDAPDLVEALRRHVPADDEEARDRDRILAFVLGHDQPFDRGIAEGHLTGSAITVSADGTRVLLLHHRKLDRWLQPGGHGDPGERTGEEVALREALEESGLRGLRLHPAAPRPLDVDVHDIPARGGEPAHEHLDLRYLVVAPEGGAIAPDLAELHDIRWVAWEDVDALGPDHGLRRALAKARAIVGR